MVASFRKKSFKFWSSSLPPFVHIVGGKGGCTFATVKCLLLVVIWQFFLCGFNFSCSWRHCIQISQIRVWSARNDATSDNWVLPIIKCTRWHQYNQQPKEVTSVLWAVQAAVPFSNQNYHGPKTDSDKDEIAPSWVIRPSTYICSQVSEQQRVRLPSASDTRGTDLCHSKTSTSLSALSAADRLRLRDMVFETHIYLLSPLW